MKNQNTRKTPTYAPQLTIPGAPKFINDCNIHYCRLNLEKQKYQSEIELRRNAIIKLTSAIPTPLKSSDVKPWGNLKP